MYKLFLTIQYLFKSRIAYFAILAVVLCTAMVLVVMSVMGGFLDQLKWRARGLLGDVIVDNRSYSGFPLYEEFIDDITAWKDDDGRPLVIKATPVLYAYGLLRFTSTPQTNTVRVVGLRLHEAYEVNAFKRSLFYEKYYPGTTTLQSQKQPLLGFDLDSEPIEWRDENGMLIGSGPRPLLPPEYQAALRQSWEAGIRDDESTDNEWAEICESAGIPPIVGQYETVEGIGPPRMAGEELPGLIIGRDIIAERESDGTYRRSWLYPRGSKVSLTILPISQAGSVELPKKPPFRYVDDSRTGIYEIDSQHVYCEFETLQKLLEMDEADRVDVETGEVIGKVRARCSQIQVKLAAGVDADALAARLRSHYRSLATDSRFELSETERRLLGYVEALTWEQSQAHIIAPVEKERQLVTTLFAGISLTSAMLVLCILYMIVLQKTRDIGIVKSIGGSHVGVALIFLIYGAAIGIVGGALGSILGCYFVTYINDIQEGLTALNPQWQVWDRSVYSFDEIPNTVRGLDVLAVFIGAIVFSTGGAVLAALRAGFMQPVEALRYE